MNLILSKSIDRFGGIRQSQQVILLKQIIWCNLNKLLSPLSEIEINKNLHDQILSNLQEQIKQIEDYIIDGQD